MRYSIEWQNEVVNTSPEEQATVGDLRLFLNDRNVTQHILNERAGEYVTVALYGLVNGLVHDWWLIFGSRDNEFSIKNYRTGYLIPDIRIQFDGLVFEFTAHPCVYSDPNLSFWGGTSEILSRQEGESRLSSFVQDVVNRLEMKGVQETSAQLRWRRIQSSLRSGESVFCEAAGGLGLDPYQIADDVADFIEKAEAFFDREQLVEFVSGSRQVDYSRLVRWVDRMLRAKGGKYRVAELRPIVEKIAREVPARLGEAAWAAGYRRARAMRRELDIKQHDRFKSFQDLACHLGAGKAFNLAPKVDGISALRREGDDGIHVHIRNHGDFDGAVATHLFALARAIGDAACFPEPQASPINRLRRAYRQAAGRAFAAEFLAPVDEIQSMIDDELDEYSIANEFGVSPRVIEHQIENVERIAEACR